MARKVPLRKVSGPHQKKSRDGYQVTTIDQSGHIRNQSFTDKGKAEVYAQRCKNEIAKDNETIIGKRDYPVYNGKMSWWLELLAAMAREQYMTKDVELRQDIKSIASASLAAKQLYDTAELENKIEALEKSQAAIISRDKHGTRISGASQSTGELSQSAQPLH